MPKEATLRLQALLNDRARGTTRKKLADILGIRETTLRGYFDDSWTVLDRAVLERLAEFFDCDVSELFTANESKFFLPFHQAGGEPTQASCFYLRRPDANAETSGRHVAFRDDRALSHITTMLADHVEGIKVFLASATKPREFDERIRQNCVVVGAPGVNQASEMAICRAFGITPFDPAECKKMPFLFTPHPRTVGTISSSLERVQAGPKGPWGIWLAEHNTLIEADYWAPQDFGARHIQRGRDCGLVLVMNHGPDVRRTRKLIVLAGFGGTGTEAAARALEEDYRNLEPRGNENHVWGVLEIFYDKEAHKTTRKIVDYMWRLRVGGRSPIKFNPRRGQPSGHGGDRRKPSGTVASSGNIPAKQRGQ